MVATVHTCRRCQSSNIIKNGKNRYGSQQYRCKECHSCAVLTPKERYTEAQKAMILRAYQERPSMRGIQRVFGVSRPTLTHWLKRG